MRDLLALRRLLVTAEMNASMSDERLMKIAQIDAAARDRPVESNSACPDSATSPVVDE
ncbi:hypothetical protein ABZT48_10880 [Streptomyces avermitilis]|uniref:hypothetical protein n=1 Tax=Streptomyces avermitilis TaxID=33903 RepID=UPI0033AA8695